jgi:hypothetical protein
VFLFKFHWARRAPADGPRLPGGQPGPASERVASGLAEVLLVPGSLAEVLLVTVPSSIRVSDTGSELLLH